MNDRESQKIRYWLTPAGCAAAGDHQADIDGTHCRLCGVLLTQEDAR